MGRLSFDYSGKLKSVDGNKLDDYPSLGKNYNDEEDDFEETTELKKSDSLKFLSEDSILDSNVSDRPHWSLYSNGKYLDPLKFSNGKTQEDVVKEIVSLIEEGHKIIFLHGACGTGKSAIALNIARILGRASIVVPVKSLQRQYEEDYMGKKYLLKKNGEKMKIAMITGRENHDSVINPGMSCADPFLPENIKITDKNLDKLIEYYKENPLIRNKVEPDFKSLRRMSIAPANPYWSPILPADFEVNQLKDARKIKYTGADGRKYVFYHRKEGCSYYDQYLAYKKADVIIFNAAKYKAELAIGRKPATDIEIIDESDDFLDGLFQQAELNLTRLSSALKSLIPESLSAQSTSDRIVELVELEEKNKKALGINEADIFNIGETKIKSILTLFNGDSELQSEIAIDELNYANKALEAARNFKDSINDVYVSFRKDDEGNLYVKLVSTNLSGKINDFIEKSKAVVFMSGTLHSENVIKKVFGIDDFRIVEAETLNSGVIEIIRTGKEIDCRYSNFSSGRYKREDYLNSLSASLGKAIMPILVHVNAFQDLPTEEEKINLGILNLTSSEKLYQTQSEDKTGRVISLFKQGLSDSLFTTKCSRGIDFPGDTCRSVVFTKYPNPNVQDSFWKILQKTHPEYFWEFYKDKARREFLQRIYRAVRSPEDHVYILSPDLRVLDAVRELQEEMEKHSKA